MSTKDAVIGLYRTFLRFSKTLSSKHRVIEFKEPVIKEWGSVQRSVSGPAYRLHAFKKALPNLEPPEDPLFSGELLTDYVRGLFKSSKDLDSLKSSERLDLAFQGLRVLFDQNYLDLCSNAEETDGILIETTSTFNMKAEDFEGKDKYVFTYRVRITNKREETVQMLGREWAFTDSGGNVVHRVHLDPENALVGHQPKLPPGATWEYYSGCPLPTPSGTGRGKLVGVVLGPAPLHERVTWVAPAVPVFSLQMPQQLH